MSKTKKAPAEKTTRRYLVVANVDNVPTVVDELELEGEPIDAKDIPADVTVGWYKDGDGVYVAPGEEEE